MILIILRWFCVAAIAVAAPSFAAAQAGSGSGRLTIEEVVKLSQSGLSEELIITKIRKNAKAFDLSTDELLELRKAGVGDNVVKFLLDPAQPYSPTPPPPAPSPAIATAAPAASIVEKSTAPAKEYPPDEAASRVPGEPGVYHFQGNAPVKLDLKILLGTKTGAGMGKVLLMKGKVVGYLPGSASKTRIAGASPAFYMRLAEGKGIEDLVLVALEPKADRREIDMGPPSPKPELKAEAIRQFESLEVGPRLFKISTGKLAKGEYLFFLIGSAEPSKGSQGKGYDFGVDAPPRPSDTKLQRKP